MEPLVCVYQTSAVMRVCLLQLSFVPVVDLSGEGAEQIFFHSVVISTMTYGCC